VTAPFTAPATDAENAWLPPFRTTGEEGETTTVIGFRLTTALPTVVPSWLAVADTETGPLPAAGAVKTPALVMVPADAFQVTDWSPVVPVTVAMKVCAAPWSRLTTDGVTDTAKGALTVTVAVAVRAGSDREDAARVCPPVDPDGAE
jgi:hypothetical protein